MFKITHGTGFKTVSEIRKEHNEMLAYAQENSYELDRNQLIRGFLLDNIDQSRETAEFIDEIRKEYERLYRVHKAKLKLVMPYINHMPDCAVVVFDNKYTCDCGFNKLDKSNHLIA